MARIFPCLAAAACCCLALLPPPVQAAGRPTGLLQTAGGGIGGRRLHLRLVPVPVPEPRFFLVPAPAEQEEARRRGVLPVTATTKARRPAAAWSVRPAELRAVPGGPDPLHHHGGSPSRRPEKDHRTPRSP